MSLSSSVPTASSIEVAVRVRPLRGELHESEDAWLTDKTSLTEIAQPDNTFTFDCVYDAQATTLEIYKRNVRDSIVARVAQGYNGTVFAYGQTGSGKSFTMFGEGSSRSPGLIRFAVHDLFKALTAELQQKPYMHTEVYASVLEIYNEQLRDLLRTEAGSVATEASFAPGIARGKSSTSSTVSPPVLSIRENEYGVFVHNALRVQVSSEQDCMSIIDAHAASRVSAATAMNAHSSRSHCVIRILVERSYNLEDAVSEQEDEEEEDEEELINRDGDSDDYTDDNASCAQAGQSGGSIQTADNTRNGTHSPRLKTTAKHRKKVISVLNMVDLAGSERVAKTGATGQRMIEGGHINKSLATLSTVINRLAVEAGRSPVSGAATPFIPYRDSRLTYLLKTAIGGNSFTALLCCVTPAIESVNESRSTLQFASRAKKIRNKVKLNEVANAQTRIRELEAALRRTRKLLVAQTLYLWSKKVRIQNYEAQLAELGKATSLEGPNARSAPTTAAGEARGPLPLLSPQGQQSMIIAQLTAQNDALMEKNRLLKARLENTANTSSAAATMGEGTDGLRRRLESTQQLLKERETALTATQASLDELDVLCRELEGENKAHTDTIKTLSDRNNDADELITAAETEYSTLQQEVKLLRSQLQQSQARLLEKNRGDDYLAELTKLHVDHQSLQYSYAQLKEKADRERSELMQRVQLLTEDNNNLADNLDEVTDGSQLANSYLWRLLSAAAQATQGKPLAVKDAAAAVRDSQVTEAVRSLTSFAVMVHNGHVSGTEDSDGAGDTRATVQQLRSRISVLEEQLMAKDAQRDVIIDTKLKRIQGLVLRLHTFNIALTAEMRRCFHDNELLFEIAGKYSKTQKRLAKAALTPQSLESALDRARFTQPPHKPLYHN